MEGGAPRAGYSLAEAAIWYGYCSYNPLRYVDPDGGESVPFFIAGPLYTYQGPIDTGSPAADVVLAGVVGVVNVAPSLVNAVAGHVGVAVGAIDAAIGWLDARVPSEWTLSGEGVREDLFRLGLFLGGTAEGQLLSELAGPALSQMRGGSSGCTAIVPYREWPSEDGFWGGFRTKETLKEGTILSRIGKPSGRYVAPPGTSLSQRGLPLSYVGRNKKESLWKVIKPFEVEAGISAPWKDASGGGIQYLLPESLEQLQAKGYIIPLE